MYTYIHIYMCVCVHIYVYIYIALSISLCALSADNFYQQNFRCHKEVTPKVTAY